MDPGQSMGPLAIWAVEVALPLKVVAAPSVATVVATARVLEPLETDVMVDAMADARVGCVAVVFVEVAPQVAAAATAGVAREDVMEVVSRVEEARVVVTWLEVEKMAVRAAVATALTA